MLTEHAFLQVHEVVEVANTGVHRLEYAYFVIYDGAELWGIERDPTHDPVLHQHDRDHNRTPCDAISFKHALTKAWEMVTDEEEFRVSSDSSSGTNGH